MKLVYKTDWEETKQRYIAWWNGEYSGRCLFWVTAPREETRNEPPPPQPQDPLVRWTNLDYLNALNAWSMRRTLYLGDSFPVWSPGYPGAVGLPTFLGSRIDLDLDTGWLNPVWNGEDWDETNLSMDRECFWWHFGIRMLNNAVEQSRGVSFPSMGAFGGTGDTLASLRDSNRLLYDVVDRPDRVRRSERRLMDLWIEMFAVFHDITREATDGGSTCWFNLWAPGRFYPTHNDFSYMISPTMYREIFLDQLRRQSEYLDYTVYHVDGISAFAHVPMLCELPKIQALQILPGAGKPSPLYYRETLEYVQSHGKNLHITIPSDEVEAAVKTLSSKGLCIDTSAESEAEARKLIRIVEKYAHE